MSTDFSIWLSDTQDMPPLKDVARVKQHLLHHDSKLTHANVHLALKHLGLKCDNSRQVYAILTDTPLPYILPHKERMCHMYEAVQTIFDRHNTEDGRFFSFSYCLYKFCHVLKIQYLPWEGCPLHLKHWDVIFKNICDDLKWE